MNEKGVSPVVGTILMVVITVILAAIIGVSLFSAANDLSVSTNTPAVLVQRINDTHIRITMLDTHGCEIDNCKLKTDSKEKRLDIKETGDFDIVRLKKGEYVVITCTVDGQEVVVYQGDVR